ncbi:hypothetical protein ACJJTC_019291 [Scirpophaga incertulas]
MVGHANHWNCPNSGGVRHTGAFTSPNTYDTVFTKTVQLYFQMVGHANHWNCPNSGGARHTGTLTLPNTYDTVFTKTVFQSPARSDSIQFDPQHKKSFKSHGRIVKLTKSVTALLITMFMDSALIWINQILVIRDSLQETPTQQTKLQSHTRRCQSGHNILRPPARRDATPNVLL